MSGFNTESYLFNLPIESLDASFLEQEFSLLERLCKKIDVVKRVYTVYSLGMVKKQSDTEISTECYIHLMKFMLVASTLSKDFKFINTALKLNDILNSKGVDEKFFLDNRSQLCSLIGVNLENT